MTSHNVHFLHNIHSSKDCLITIDREEFDSVYLQVDSQLNLEVFCRCSEQHGKAFYTLHAITVALFEALQWWPQIVR